MNGEPKKRTVLLTIAGALWLTSLTTALDPPQTPRVEHESRRWPEGQGCTLGTIGYRPSQQEQSVFNRLPPGEVVTGSLAEDYDISTKDNVYVGWFGIVRRIDEDKTALRTVLTVEHKDFDGLTDVHQQTVCFNGAGDFLATLTGTDHRIPPLSLVKVYGTVSKSQAGELPRIDAAFVRCWHRGMFAFIGAYGTQRGNEAWRQANQIPLDEIYEAWPHPCHHYYEQRLGKRPDDPEIRKRLLDATGPLSADARQAMERLADLLAVGHPWSPAETERQSEEYRLIRTLVKATGSQKAAVGLLLQALQENDERVSWSASEKFHALDPSGDAIETLVKFLDAPDLRVREGAARALGSGYEAKAEPAVAALSRCITESDPELKAYAILALGDIGPAARAAVSDLIPYLDSNNQWIVVSAVDALAKIGPDALPAVPALTRLLECSDDDGIRACVARALWHVNRYQPAIAVLQDVLRNSDDTCGLTKAARAIGEMGPPARGFAPLLGPLLKNSDPLVRDAAKSALEQIEQN